MGISYTQFLTEQQRGKTVVFSFGRFNPPTIGHERLIDAVAKTAKKYRTNDFFIYPSQSEDSKKNPLSFKEKIFWMKKVFPKYKKNIVGDTGVRTALDVAVKLNGKYDHMVMVVGSDRIETFKSTLTKYNGIDSRHGYYEFKGIDVISAGERDPDAEGAEGMSASKMRGAASKNNFSSFRKGIPSSLGDSDAKKMMDTVRKGMKLEMTLAKLKGEYIEEDERLDALRKKKDIEKKQFNTMRDKHKVDREKNKQDREAEKADVKAVKQRITRHKLRLQRAQ